MPTAVPSNLPVHHSHHWYRTCEDSKHGNEWYNILDTHSSHLFSMWSFVFLHLWCQNLLWIAARQLGFLVKVQGIVELVRVQLHLRIDICPRVIDSQSLRGAPRIQPVLHPWKTQALGPEAVHFENSKSMCHAWVAGSCFGVVGQTSLSFCCPFVKSGGEGCRVENVKATMRLLHMAQVMTMPNSAWLNLVFRTVQLLSRCLYVHTNCWWEFKVHSSVFVYVEGFCLEICDVREGSHNLFVLCCHSLNVGDASHVHVQGWFKVPLPHHKYICISMRACRTRRHYWWREKVTKLLERVNSLHRRPKNGIWKGNFWKNPGSCIFGPGGGPKNGLKVIIHAVG